MQSKPVKNTKQKKSPQRDDIAAPNPGDFFPWFAGLFRRLFFPKMQDADQQEKQGKKRSKIPSPEELQALLKKYQNAIRDNPQDFSAHFKLGEIYVMLERYSDAIPPLREAMRVDNYDMESPFLLGKSLVILGRDDEALEHLKKAHELNYESEQVRKFLAEAHKNMCVVYGKLKRYGDAAREFKDAIKAKPDYGEAYLALGAIYVQAGRYKDALDKFNKALKLDKHLAVEAHYNLGVAYSKQGDIKTAVKHYKEAILINPKSALPQLHLGLIYMKEEKYADAVLCLHTAVKLSPRVASEGFLKLGFALAKLERYEDAVEPLKEALKINPNNDLALEALGDALYRTFESWGKIKTVKERVDFLKSALEYVPAHPQCQKTLGEIYDNVMDGVNAVIHTTIAQLVYAEQKKKKEAEATLTDLVMLYKKYNLNSKDFSTVKIPRKK